MWDRRRGRSGNDARVRKRECSDDECDECERFECARNLLRPPCLAHSEPVDCAEEHQRRQCDYADMSRKKWNDRSDVFAREEDKECVSQPEVEPVSVSDEESHAVAECTVRESVGTARARDHRAELGVDGGAEQSDYSTEHPDRHEECAAGKRGCNRSGSAENSTPDGCADNDCESECPAENSQQGRL